MNPTLIYRQKETKTDSVYLLKDGMIRLQLNQEDTFSLNTKNFIFGGIEILLSEEDKVAYSRTHSAEIEIDQEGNCVRIPRSQFLSSLSHYGFSLALARSMCLVLNRINQMLIKKRSGLKQKDYLSQEYCKTFASTVDILLKFFEEKRFPWLKEICDQAKNSLTYVKGSAFLSSSRSTEIDLPPTEDSSFAKKFAPHTIICREGEEGNELYILQSGKLKVLINNNPIAEIQRVGSVIGEMSLIMGEQRNATLQAVEETVLTVVKKENLKDFLKQHPNFLKQISLGIARHIAANIIVIKEINQLLKVPNEEEPNVPRILTSDPHKEELKNLKQKVFQLYEKYNMEWLEKLYVEITDRMLDLAQGNI